jgi:hypothetical protein
LRSLERWWWPLQLAAILGAAVFALLFHARLPSRLPSDDSYRQVAEVLAREALPGDAVLLFPWWTERARIWLAEDPPVVGYLGSDADPLVRHPRIWVLAQPNLPRADATAFWRVFAPGRRREGEARQFGNLQLTLFENGRHRPIRFSATDEVESAIARGDASGVSVYLEAPDGRRTPCPLAGAPGAFRCSGPTYLYVRTEWHEVLYEPRRCLYMHAPGGVTRMVVELDRAALGGEALLEAGVIWEHAAKKGGRITPTAVAVEDASSGARFAEVILPPGTEGFQRARVSGEGGARPVRIAVSSFHPDAREICVDFTAFGAREAVR